ncbi:MAG TPA: nuclease-related domain-containing protein [Solirubrobacteraceae bacterium]|jgi:hypothetical protein
MGQLENADVGVAGDSARREAERVRQMSEDARAARSRLASVFLGPSAEYRRLATRESRWATGARGEELLADSLRHRCPGVLLLHDRRMPGSRANIDHIAVAQSGVYVIDAKCYRGKIEVHEPLFGQPKLLIAGRDRTKLVAGLVKQVAAVRGALADVEPEVPVDGCFCFVAPEGRLADVGLPLLRTLRVNGFPLYYSRRLAKRLNSGGALGSERAAQIHAQLARSLKRA